MRRLEQITYGDKTYQIKLHRKLMHRITMRPNHDGLLVHAPLGVPLSFIKSTILKHMPKLVNALNTIPAQTSEYVFFLGHRHERSDDYLKTIFKAALDDYLSPAFERELRIKAETFLTKRTRYYEQLMGITTPYQIKIRRMKARLGSNAKTTHTITYALKLIHYSIPIIDAVVVHELAHAFAFDHSKNFYDIINKYYPNYKQEHGKIRQGLYR